MNFGTTLFNQISRYSRHNAIFDGVNFVSYDELNRISLRIANILKTSSVNRPVVGIVGQRNFSSYFGILGSIYAGCTYVPINNKYSHDRIQDIISQADITVIIGESDAIIPLRQLLAKTIVHTIIMPDLAFCVDDILIGNDFQIFDNNKIQQTASLDQPISVSSSDTLYILFTSGSTGIPKGVIISHGNASSYLQNLNSFYSLSAGYKASQTFDLSFDLSFVDTFYTWFLGGQLCILGPTELIMPIDYIQRNQIVFWFSVPTLINFMFKMGYLLPNSFPSIRYSLFCGEPLNQKLADAWQISAPNSTIENHYGPTEATVSISRYNYKKTDSMRSFNNNILPIGQIYKDHHAVIVDENLQPLPVGQKGQLILKGSQISMGYLNNVEKTNSSFQPFAWDPSEDIWYLTGDLASINNNQEIECFGRLDNQIKISGRRVELGEIEYTLLSTELLSDVVVVPVYGENYEVSCLCAFTSTQLSVDEKKTILTKSLQSIEKLFLPRDIKYIESLPLTLSGKVDRKKLFEVANKK